MKSRYNQVDFTGPNGYDSDLSPIWPIFIYHTDIELHFVSGKLLFVTWWIFLPGQLWEKAELVWCFDLFLS